MQNLKRELVEKARLLATSSITTKSDLYRIAHETSRLLILVFRLSKSAVSFNEEERRELGPVLAAALPKIAQGVEQEFVALGPEQLSTARIFRSGLQFLIDDFRTFPVINAQGKEQTLQSILETLAKSEEMVGIDEDLQRWNDAFPDMLVADDEKPDLTGVPISHRWWKQN